VFRQTLGLASDLIILLHVFRCSRHSVCAVSGVTRAQNHQKEQSGQQNILILFGPSPRVPIQMQTASERKNVKEREVADGAK